MANLGTGQGASSMCTQPSMARGYVWAIGRRSLVLTDRELRLRAGFYSAKVALGDLRLDQASEDSIFRHPEYTPRWRTNGIRLPTYRVGWFRLRNGDSALLYLTDPFSVTRLPTARGFVLLLSTDALLPALQARMAAVDSAPG